MEKFKEKLKKIKLIVFLYKILKEIYIFFRRSFNLFHKLSLVFFWYIFQRKKMYNYFYDEYNFYKIKLVKPLSWHLGCKYFVAELNNKKIFIKLNGKFNLVSREARIINELRQNYSHYFPKIIINEANGLYKFIALEFIEGIDLMTALNNSFLNNQQKDKILKDMFFLAKYLNKNKIIHMDIRPNNFILKKNDNGEYIDLMLIDFSFSIKKGEELSEIDKTPKNLKILKYLGSGFNPNYFHWDDAFSFLNIFKLLNKNFKRDNKYIWLEINKMIGTLDYKICLFGDKNNEKGK